MVSDGASASSAGGKEEMKTVERQIEVEDTGRTMCTPQLARGEQQKLKQVGNH